MWVSCVARVALVVNGRGNSGRTQWHIVVLIGAELNPPSSCPTTFIELLGCKPTNYTSLTIVETWFRQIPIYEISQVRLRLLRRCCQWGLLYQSGISGSCWIDGLRRTWVTQVGKSGQQIFVMHCDSYSSFLNLFIISPQIWSNVFYGNPIITIENFMYRSNAQPLRVVIIWSFLMDLSWTGCTFHMTHIETNVFQGILTHFH